MSTKYVLICFILFFINNFKIIFIIDCYRPKVREFINEKEKNSESNHRLRLLLRRPCERVLLYSTVFAGNNSSYFSCALHTHTFSLSNHYTLTHSSPTMLRRPASILADISTAARHSRRPGAAPLRSSSALQTHGPRSECGVRS